MGRSKSKAKQSGRPTGGTAPPTAVGQPTRAVVSPSPGVTTTDTPRAAPREEPPREEPPRDGRATPLSLTRKRRGSSDDDLIHMYTRFGDSFVMKVVKGDIASRNALQVYLSAGAQFAEIKWSNKASMSERIDVVIFAFKTDRHVNADAVDRWAQALACSVVKACSVRRVACDVRRAPHPPTPACMDAVEREPGGGVEAA